MQIAGRHWAAAFGTAVLIHAGLALAVLSRAPETDVGRAAPAGIRVSLGAPAGTPESVSVAGSEVAAAPAATAREVADVPSTAAGMPAASELPALQPIRAAEIRAIESVGAGFGASPVAPTESTPIAETIPVESAQVTSVEVASGVALAEAAPSQVPSPVTLVDASPSIKAVEIRAVESVNAGLDAVPVVPAEPTPIEEPLPVESAQVTSVEAASGVELAEAAPFEEPSPAKLADLSPSVEPAKAQVTDGMPALESGETVPSTTSPRLDPAFAAAPVEPKESAPIEEPLPVDPAGVTFVETPRAVEPAKETWVEASLPGERASVMPVEVPEMRQAVPVARVGPPSRTQAVARTPSTPDGRAATGTVDGVAGVATSIGSAASPVQPDYLMRVQAWIEKHKEYPYRARLRREEGTALLYFVVDRDGRVRDYELRQSTGHALLDREVLAMIERAQPLPRARGHLNPVALEMIVPVRFSLR